MTNQPLVGAVAHVGSPQQQPEPAARRPQPAAAAAAAAAAHVSLSWVLSVTAGGLMTCGSLRSGGSSRTSWHCVLTFSALVAAPPCACGVAGRSSRKAKRQLARFDRVWEGLTQPPAALAPIDVPGDGNCLFASIAVAHAAATTGEVPSTAALVQRARQLRLQANDLLCPGGQPSEDEINGFPLALVMEPAAGEDGCGYCARMRRDGQWGSAAEILALTKVLHSPIAVYHRPAGAATSPPEEMDTYGADEDGPRLAILYLHGTHYNALIPGAARPPMPRL